MLFTMLSMMWVWRLGSWCCVLARAWWALNNKLFIRAVFCAQNYIWCDYVSLYGIVLCLVPVLWLIGILPVPIMVIIIRRLPDIIKTRTRDRESDDDPLAWADTVPGCSAARVAARVPQFGQYFQKATAATMQNCRVYRYYSLLMFSW